MKQNHLELIEITIKLLIYGDLCYFYNYVQLNLIESIYWCHESNRHFFCMLVYVKVGKRQFEFNRKNELVNRKSNK